MTRPEAIRQADSTAYHAYQHQRQRHWDNVAAMLDTRTSWGIYYHQRMEHVFQFFVAPNQRVLEIGCASGDLLAAVQPAYGVGVDFSPAMLRRATQRHPHLHFLCADAHTLALDQTFDVIILSDLANDLWDVQTTLEQVARLTTPHTRIILNLYSKLWELPLTLVRRLGLALPNLPQNWLTVEDITSLLYLANFEVIRHEQEVLLPLPESWLTTLANRYLARIPPFSHLALTNVLVARRQPQPAALPQEPLVSVVVPARNEAGNIAAAFERTPDMGRGTELVFVEGHSKDNTYEAIQQAMAAYPHRQSKLLQQRGKGKGDAVRLGFAQSSGDILMILDADLTVPPEDLPRFYDVLVSGKGEFVNGVRLVYPMEQRAMRFFNLLGNKFFSLAFSALLGQSVKDTLCGTKVLWKSDYELIAANRAYFGDFDPFGDYDLLFGAARLGLKIVDVPIRYRERIYGTTNIHRWKHGWLLLKMVTFASKRIKFI